ncbi:hypothetical protein EON81_05470 [bacterium]|nr:MAG: hypothetical protein EON81_05470 [bacterium]
MTTLLAMLSLLSIEEPPLQARERPVWSKTISLQKVSLTLRVWKFRNAPTEVEISRGGGVIGSASDEALYFYESVRPYIWIDGNAAVLVYAASPGAGTGQYASMWKIGDHGRRIEPIGSFLYGDLRKWRSHGIVREFRPTKYATEDILKVFPTIFDDERFRNKWFALRYKFNRRTKHFTLIRVRIATKAESGGDSVHFPRP